MNWPGKVDALCLSTLRIDGPEHIGSDGRLGHGSSPGRHRGLGPGRWKVRRGAVRFATLNAPYGSALFTFSAGQRSVQEFAIEKSGPRKCTRTDPPPSPGWGEDRSLKASPRVELKRSILVRSGFEAGIFVQCPDSTAAGARKGRWAPPGSSPGRHRGWVRGDGRRGAVRFAALNAPYELRTPTDYQSSPARWVSRNSRIAR